MDSFFSMPPRETSRRASAGDELLTDYRQRRALEEQDRAERKRMDSAEQLSPLNSVDVRIRAWEKTHHLRMPADPEHPVLDAIATATQLSLEDVRAEQQLRTLRRASAGG
jgi:hypothetical protein